MVPSTTSESRVWGGAATAASPVPAFAADLQHHGSRPAVVTADGVTWSYSELAERADDVAARIGAGRRLVAVEAGADPSSLVAYLGALRGGHVALLVPPGPEGGAGGGSSESGVLRAWDPDVVVAGSGAAVPRVEVRRPAPAVALHPDLGLLLSTSGSTGSPKLVRLGVEGMQANATAIATYLGLTVDDRAAMTLPMHYCYGLSVVSSHLAVGASVVLGGGSVVDRCFWDRFRRHGCTNFAGVPHTFDLLDRAGFEAMELSSLRLVTQAGGRLAPDTVVRYAELGRERGWELFVMYGQTEATARMAYLPPELAASHPGAIGRAIPGGELRIDVPDRSGSGEPEEPGDIGELVYRGPNVMLGYALEPGDLSRGREVDELRTGDLARLTPDGLVEVVGRTSRFVKLFGVRIDLDRVEAVLGEMGFEGLCVGDDAELVVGVVGTEVDAAAAGAAVRLELGLPRSAVRAVALGSVPRLASGKPDRESALRHRAGTEVTERDGEARSPVLGHGPGRPRGLFRRRPRRSAATVRGAYAAVLGVAEIADHDTFVSLGGDSLSYVEVSVLLEEAVGELPPSWHTTPVAELEAGARPAGVLAGVEGNVALRALAIALVVGTHASVFRIQGGAHLLLAVAGYNFARFRLSAAEVGDRLRRELGTILRIAVPVVLWVCFMFTWREPFSVPRLLLLDNVAGEGLWRYWYAEVLVQLLLGLTLLFGIRSVRDAERRRPFTFAVALLGATLAVRFGWSPLGQPAEAMYRTDTVAWFFVLGWAVQRASTTAQRALLTAVLVVSVPGFFDSAQRGAVVGLGLVALVWVTRVRVPRPLNRWVSAVAAASLAIFLTHFAVLPWLRPHLPPLAVMVAALLVGVSIDLLGARVRPGDALGRAGRRVAGYLGGYTRTGSGRTTTSTSPSSVRLAASTGSSPSGVCTTEPSLTPRTTSPRPMNSATTELAGER